MSPVAGLFVRAVLRHESRRFNYVHTWTLERMPRKRLNLPADTKGTLDVVMMETVATNCSPFGQLLTA